MTATVYCIDTSSLLEAWVKRYPIEVFPDLWADLEQLIESGRLISPEEVKVEILKKDDDLADWAQSQNGLFIPFDEEQQGTLIHVMTHHELLVKSTKRRHAADPFVIALAHTRACTVITEEGRGSPEKPKIPDVCQAMQVDVMSLVDLLKQERWAYHR